MSIIVPAILPHSRAELDEALARLAPVAEISEVQIDVVDGRFAKPATWPYATSEVWELPHTDRFRFDLDLMVIDPEVSFQRWVELGAARITLHVESTTKLRECITDFKRHTGHDVGFTPGMLSLGLAINIGTPLSLIEPFIKEVDYVQFMGIATIGLQGQPFDERVLARVHELHTKYPELPLQVDGGVSIRTAPELLKAGASRLVAGSAILKADDVAKAFTEFESLGDHFGAYER